MPSLSIIVPVYNEAENFPQLITAIETHCEPPFTVFVIYDFPEDNTVPVATQLAASRPWLRLLRNSHGRGVVNAFRTGFEAVGQGPALVVMADLSDDLTVVSTLQRLYEEGYRVVCPSRYAPGGRQLGGPPLKRLLSRLAGVSLHTLAGLPTRDATNNFRLYDAAFVNEVGIESTGGFEIALELTAKAHRRGLRITEVPSTWRDRSAGTSRFRLARWLPKYLYWYGYALASRVTTRADGARR